MTTSRSPQSSVNSVPMISFRDSLTPPSFFTAECARTTPASEHSSVMASAGNRAFRLHHELFGVRGAAQEAKLLRQCSSA